MTCCEIWDALRIRVELFTLVPGFANNLQSSENIPTGISYSIVNWKHCQSNLTPILPVCDTNLSSVNLVYGQSDLEHKSNNFTLPYANDRDASKLYSAAGSASERSLLPPTKIATGG
jgi:hypothetical protein